MTLNEIKTTIAKYLSIPMPQTLAEFHYSIIYAQVRGHKPQQECLMVALAIWHMEHKHFEQAHVQLQSLKLPTQLPFIEMIKAHLESILTENKTHINAEFATGPNYENQLLDLLMRQSISRIKAIEEIYGDRIDWQIAERRFRHLLFRLKRKFPGLIQQNDELLEIKKKHFLN